MEQQYYGDPKKDGQHVDAQGSNYSKALECKKIELLSVWSAVTSLWDPRCWTLGEGRDEN